MTRGVRFRMPVRYVFPDGWEAFCGECRSWWPLDLTYWSASIRGGKCRACHNIKEAQRQRIQNAKDEAKRQRHREAARKYRESWTEAERAAVNAKGRLYLATHREENRERGRLRRERARQAKAA